MRTLGTMTPGEVRQYVAMLGEAAKGVMTPDAHFVLVVFGPGGTAHYAADIDRASSPAAIRELARHLDGVAAELERARGNPA